MEWNGMRFRLSQFNSLTTPGSQAQATPTIRENWGVAKRRGAEPPWRKIGGGWGPPDTPLVKQHELGRAERGGARRSEAEAGRIPCGARGPSEHP